MGVQAHDFWSFRGSRLGSKHTTFGHFEAPYGSKHTTFGYFEAPDGGPSTRLLTTGEHISDIDFQQPELKNVYSARSKNECNKSSPRCLGSHESLFTAMLNDRNHTPQLLTPNKTTTATTITTIFRPLLTLNHFCVPKYHCFQIPLASKLLKNSFLIM